MTAALMTGCSRSSAATFPCSTRRSGSGSTTWSVPLRPAGITVLLNVAHYTSDFASGPLAGKTSGQLAGYGTVLGNRYKTRANLVWLYGGDYFDGLTTELTALTGGITGTGDTHLLGIENYPETTSRKDIFDNSTLTTGTNLSDFNFVYSYNVTYDGVEYAWA